MKSIKENYGLYSILLVLLYFLGLFLYQFKYGMVYSSQRIDLLFGPLPWVFLLLIIGAIASIFVKYKYSWVTISLPFIWNLLLPLKVPATAGFRGSIINMIITLPQNLNVALIMLLGSLLSLFCITYLIIKNIKQIKDSKFEIISAILILIFLLIRIF